MSVLHGYRDIKPLIFLDHDLDLLGSRDVIGHVTSYTWSIVTIRLTGMVMEI